ncbi:MAG: hypothetical protein OQK78_09190, partial [Gammaproteobacteria bacterium]|nr:hypothetical protein [Gammaproteobacteria bacterium]
DETKLLAGIENLIQQTLVREQEPGFVPKHNVPLTKHKAGGNKPKNPKKQKIKNFGDDDRPKRSGAGKPGSRSPNKPTNKQGRTANTDGENSGNVKSKRRRPPHAANGNSARPKARSAKPQSRGQR